MKFYDIDMDYFLTRSPSTRANGQLMVGDERELIQAIHNQWQAAGRPYYKIYPAFAAAASKLMLGETLERFPPPTTDELYAIRLPDPSPIVFTATSPAVYLRTAIGVFTPAHDDCPPALAFFADGMFWESDTRFRRVCTMGFFKWAAKIECVIEGDGFPYRGAPGEPSDRDSTHWFVNSAMQLAMFVRMIAHDPAYVTPVVLAKDEPRRSDADPEMLARMVDRAKRRGEFGWHLGREYESIPHLRRPHFAIRWLGHGPNKTPALRPIRGSVVHRESATRVPTGRYDDAGNELEPEPSPETTP